MIKYSSYILILLLHLSCISVEEKNVRYDYNSPNDIVKEYFYEDSYYSLESDSLVSRLIKKSVTKQEEINDLIDIKDFIFLPSGNLYVIKDKGKCSSCLFKYENDKLSLISAKSIKEFAFSQDEKLYGYIDLPKHKNILHRFTEDLKWEIVIPGSSSNAILGPNSECHALKNLPNGSSILSRFRDGKWHDLPHAVVIDLTTTSDGKIFAILGGTKYNNGLYKLEGEQWELVNNDLKYSKFVHSFSENIFIRNTDNSLIDRKVS